MQLYDRKIDVHGSSLECYIKNSSNIKLQKDAHIKKKQKLNLQAFKVFNKEIYRYSNILKN